MCDQVGERGLDLVKKKMEAICLQIRLGRLWGPVFFPLGKDTKVSGHPARASGCMGRVSYPTE